MLAQSHENIAHRVTSSNSATPRLPLLENAVQEFGTLDSSVKVVVGLQHLLGSTVTLIDGLVANGIDPQNVFLLGKPYSTSPRVMRTIEHYRSWWVHPESTLQAVDVDNDSEMDRRIEDLMHAVEARMSELNFAQSDRVLLIDDGGRAIRLLHSDRFEHLLKHFVCVEQTRCGVSTLEGLDLRVPVVNVAQSFAKLQYESPLIADSVIHEIRRQLWSLSRLGIAIDRSVSILGFGSIGAAIASAFSSDGYTIFVHDSDLAKAAAAKAEGYSLVTTKRELLERGGLIVGCTGRPSVGEVDYPFIAHNSLLVSASSSDLEFQAWNLRKTSTCLGNPASPRARKPHPCFSLYRVHNQGCGFYLVNGGFPVNFTGGVDPIAPELIQLTRTLLYVGSVQASREHGHGWVSLDEQAQHFAIRGFSQSIAA